MSKSLILTFYCSSIILRPSFVNIVRKSKDNEDEVFPTASYLITRSWVNVFSIRMWMNSQG